MPDSATVDWSEFEPVSTGSSPVDWSEFEAVPTPFKPPSLGAPPGENYNIAQVKSTLDTLNPSQRRDWLQADIDRKSAPSYGPIELGLLKAAGALEGPVYEAAHPVRSLVNLPEIAWQAIQGRKTVDESQLPLPPGYNPLKIEIPPDANIAPGARPFVEAGADVMNQITDPDVLATLPVAEAKVFEVPALLGKVYTMVMGGQLPKQAMDLKDTLQDPNTTPDEKKKAAAEFALIAAGTVAAGRGFTRGEAATSGKITLPNQPPTPEMEALAKKSGEITPKAELPPELAAAAQVLPRTAAAVKEVQPAPNIKSVSIGNQLIDQTKIPPTEEVSDALQKQSPGSVFQYPPEGTGETGSERGGVEPVQQGEAPTETQQAPPTGTPSVPVRSGEVTPKDRLTPAVRVGNQIFTGKNHGEIIVNAAKSGEDATGGEKGFVQGGKFITRKEAAGVFEQQTGKKPAKEGELHSEDLKAEGMLGHLDEPPKPLNPGGAQSGLSPEKQAQSKANNGPAAFAAQQSGWTFDGVNEAPGMSTEGMTPEMKAQVKPMLAFTDRRKGSPTEGITTYVPVDAKYADIVKALKDKSESVVKATNQVTIRSTSGRVLTLTDEDAASYNDVLKTNGKQKANEMAFSHQLPSQLAKSEAAQKAKQAAIPWDIKQADKYLSRYDYFPTVEKHEQDVYGEPSDHVLLSPEEVAERAEINSQMVSGESKTEPPADVKSQSFPAGPSAATAGVPNLGPAMGADILGANALSPQTPTGIKNATVDQERAARGLPSAYGMLKRDFGTVWDAVMAKIDRDPAAQDRLIAELKSRPRAVNDEESAMLLHWQVGLQNEYGKATRELAQAYDDNQPEMAATQKIRLAEISDELLELYDINKFVGTETGRGLNARKMMANEDFTLAKMELDKRAANQGAPLTDEQRTEIIKQQAKIESTQKKVDEHESAAETTSATKASQQEFEPLAKEAASESKAGKQPTVEDLTRALKNRQKNGSTPPEAASLIQKLARAFVRQGVKERVPLIDAVHGIVKGLWPDMTWRETMDAISGYGNFKQLSKDEITVQLRDLKGQMQQAAKALDIFKGEPPSKTGFERRTPSDAERRLIQLVNEMKKRFGVETTDPATQLKSSLASLKTRLKNQISDLEEQLASKTKFVKERAPVPEDAESTALRDQRDKLKAEFDQMFGKPEMSDEQRVKLALASLERQATEVERQLKEGDIFPVKSVSKTPQTAAIEAAKAKLDALKTERDYLRESIQPGNVPPTDSELAAKALESQQKVLQKRIVELEGKVREGDFSAKNKPINRPAQPELELLRQKRDALNQQIAAARNAAKPKLSMDEIALKALKTRLKNRTAELLDKLAKGDFSKTTRRTTPLDVEAERLRAANEQAKREFQLGLQKDRLKQRTPWEKTMDTLVKWRRGFLLSGPVTLAKLTSAAVQRLAVTPVEEGVGGLLSKAFPGLADKAAREGSLSTKAEAKALTEGFTKGMRDAWQTLKTGSSDLDSVYGKRLNLPPSAIDFLGHVHAALKSVTKRAEFARSFEKRAAAAIANGVDASDPLVQSRLAMDAYKDANRSIFMQDNRVVNAYKRALSALDEPDKATGRVPLGRKAAGTAMRVLLPIVKIPTNIAAETIQYATGSVTGSAQLAMALRRGVENVKPEESEMILRNLKKGSLGAAVLLTGYFNANSIGGYYQPGEKRKAGDVKAGNVRIAGHQIPGYLLHNPLTELLQIGATIRRVSDSKLSKKDTGNQGIPAGVMAGALGLSEEIPFVREMTETAKAFDPKERGQFTGELGKSLLVPQVMQWAATQTDKDANGNVVARKPSTPLEYIETGIPGLRKNVKRNPKQPTP